MANEYLQPFVAQIVGGARVCALDDVREKDTESFGFIDVEAWQIVGESDSFHELTRLLKQLQKKGTMPGLNASQFTRVFKLLPNCTPAPILGKLREKFNLIDEFTISKRFFVGFYFNAPLSAMCELLDAFLSGDMERTTQIVEFMHSATPPESINNKTSNSLFNLMLRLVLFGILGKVLNKVPKDLKDQDVKAARALRIQAYKFHEYFKELFRDKRKSDMRPQFGTMLLASLNHMRKLKRSLECAPFDDTVLLIAACAHLANSLSNKCAEMGIMDSCM